MKKIILICIVLGAMTIQGCNKWLDVQPSDRQTEKQTFSSKAGFYSAVNGIYNKLNSKSLYGGQLSYNMVDILAKRYVIASVNNKEGTAFLKGAYTDESASNVIQGVWETAYNLILNCNIVLTNLETNKSVLAEKDYSIIKGEMLALRAFLHFDMLRLFGPVYKVSPNNLSIPYNVSSEGAFAPILPASEIVTNYILVDIQKAEELLKNYDPVIKDGAMADDIKDELSIYSDENLYRYRQLRFNYYALLTLKARVQLYVGDNANALITAKSVINSEEIKAQFPAINSSLIVGNNSNPDRMFTSEVFFGMYYKERNEVNKAFFDPETAGSYLLQPRSGYLENTLFSGMGSDYRLKGQWVVPSTAGNTNRTLGKYKDINNKYLFYATFVPLLRFSEMYLIAAEAEPNVADGLAHLNYLRVNMRGNIGMPLTNITSKTALNDEIKKEYAREFYGEGQFFYYLKRVNISLFMSSSDNGNANSSFYSIPYVLPLPESETTPR